MIKWLVRQHNKIAILLLIGTITALLVGGFSQLEKIPKFNNLYVTFYIAEISFFLFLIIHDGTRGFVHYIIHICEKYSKYLIIALALFFLFFAWNSSIDGHNWGGDHAMYISQAVAILNGNVKDLYVNNKFSMDNSEGPLGPYLYPMGYPILLTPIILFLGINLKLLKFYTFFFLILSIYPIYKLFSNNLYKYNNKKIIVFLIILCTLGNDKILLFARGYLYSDIPFFFFYLLGIWLIDQNRKITGQIITGIIIFYSFFTREVGITLLPALFIKDFFVDKFKLKDFRIFLLPYITFFICFLTSNLLFQFDRENLHLKMLYTVDIQTVLGNIRYYILDYLKFLDPIGQLEKIKIILKLFYISTFIVGLIRTLKTHLHWFVILISILGINSLMPFVTPNRCLFPLVPFLYFYIIMGTDFCLIKLLKFKNNALRSNILTYILILSIGIQYMNSVFMVTQDNDTDISSNSPEINQVYEYIQNNLDTQEIIGFFKPRVLRLFTGNNSIGVYTLDFFLNSNIKYYLLLKDLSYQIYQSEYSDRLSIEYENEAYVLLKK